MLSSEVLAHNCVPSRLLMHLCKNFSCRITEASPSTLFIGYDSMSAASFSPVLLFSGTEGLLLLQRSVSTGRAPANSVLAFGLHKPQLPNKYYSKRDRGGETEQSCLHVQDQNMFHLRIRIIKKVSVPNERIERGSEHKTITLR